MKKTKKVKKKTVEKYLSPYFIRGLTFFFPCISTWYLAALSFCVRHIEVIRLMKEKWIVITKTNWWYHLLKSHYGTQFYILSLPHLPMYCYSRNHCLNVWRVHTAAAAAASAYMYVYTALVAVGCPNRGGGFIYKYFCFPFFKENLLFLIFHSTECSVPK